MGKKFLKKKWKYLRLPAAKQGYLTLLKRGTRCKVAGSRSFFSRNASKLA